MKIDKDKIMNLCKDIFPSIGWGVNHQTLLVDSDDETIQERINQLNKTEHEMLGEILKGRLNIWMEQGSR